MIDGIILCFLRRERDWPSTDHGKGVVFVLRAMGTKRRRMTGRGVERRPAEDAVICAALE